MRVMTGVLGAGVAICVAACGSPGSSDGACASNQPVTYENNIKDILDNHCTKCHAEDKHGPMRLGAPDGVNLDGYDNAKKNAEDSNNEVKGGDMPPPLVVSRLSDKQRCLIQAWVDQGTPR